MIALNLFVYVSALNAKRNFRLMNSKNWQRTTVCCQIWVIPSWRINRRSFKSFQFDELILKLNHFWNFELRNKIGFLIGKILNTGRLQIFVFALGFPNGFIEIHISLEIIQLQKQIFQIKRNYAKSEKETKKITISKSSDNAFDMIKKILLFLRLFNKFARFL